MLKKYRKKPVVIEAMLFDGTLESSNAVLSWIGVFDEALPEEAMETITIPTLEGLMTASVGDYIIKGVKGEFYPCKPDIFEATYEEVFQILRAVGACPNCGLLREPEEMTDCDEIP